MDESVNPASLLRVRLLACMRVALLSLFGLTLLPGSLQAQTLPDPTRPASGTSQPGAAEESPGGPQLQSILISPKRKLAVINGQTLHIGDSFGSAIVVKISAQEVVLKSGGELQVLKLFPGVEKRKSVAGKVASQKVKDR